MPFVFSIKDTYRQAVEAATGGKNTVMYDDKGNPSIMVAIPKFNIGDVIDGGPATVHPAFLVNGVEKSEIWISKYINCIHDGRAYSLPGMAPKHTIDFNASRAACFAKGPGWHLMTNAEWAAIALWCLANDFQPRGNDDYGKSYEAAWEYGVKDGTSGRTLTGTGPASWNHDGTPAGIADLRGNVREWVDGFKTIDGRIYVHPDNDFDTGNIEGNVDGWQDLGLYFDEATGSVVINDQVVNQHEESSISHEFKTVAAADGITIPDIMRHLLIAPPTDVSKIGGDYIYMRNVGERVPTRGGHWYHGSPAGLFYLNLPHERSNTSNSLGFRSAFVS